jgi:hypothetical protein
MRKIFALLVTCFLVFSITPAMAQTLDLSGPWILDFPQGRGMAIFQQGGAFGQVTIPYSGNSSGTLTFNVKLLSDPSYVVPGNNITFQSQSAPGINFFMMNLSSSSNGVAWIIPHGGADTILLKLSEQKAVAHR